MKVITIVRTLNEQRNIRRFIEAHYPFSDKILVADGGSFDDTLAICNEYTNVVVRAFEPRIMHSDGTFRNPENAHFNFLVRWAEEEGADWIVQNDCDHEPNSAIRSHVREIFEHTDASLVKALLFYVYKWTHYFPKLNAHVSPEYIWAWKPSVYRMEYDETNTTSPTYVPFEIRSRVLTLPHPPFVVLHHGSQDDEHIEGKRLRYLNYGWTIPHPLLSGGEPAELPEWVNLPTRKDMGAWLASAQ